MSMNLIFDVKGGSGIVDFPFQTSTDLTYAVLNAKTKEEQVALVEKEMRERGFKNHQIKEQLGTVKALLSNPNLSISMI